MHPCSQDNCSTILSSLLIDLLVRLITGCFARRCPPRQPSPRQPSPRQPSPRQPSPRQPWPTCHPK